MSRPSNPLAALLGLLFLVNLQPNPANAQDSTFTYQGQLRQTGQPFTGTADLEFRLYDQLSAGGEIGSVQTLPNWPVEDGLFQVELDFGAAAFDGSERFLEITVDGAVLVPRQKVTATPYALLATGLASGSVGGGSVEPSEVQLRVTGTCPADQAIREINEDGSVVCETDDIGVPSWALNGNSGTDPTTDFIGTTDPSALELRTANTRSLRLEPSVEIFEGSPITSNVIAGSRANEVLNGARGATIAGGGMPSGDTDPGINFEDPNRVSSHYGTISGGYGNFAGTDNPQFASAATVSGGARNTASGSGSTISGGSRNTASATSSNVGGGSANTASGLNSTVGGGRSNTASGSGSTVSGGGSSIATGDFSLVAGGQSHNSSGFASTVGGGATNRAIADYSTVAGGLLNSADFNSSTVSGGRQNDAAGVSSIVGGGDSNRAAGTASVVSGGEANDASADFSTVGGGGRSTASGLFSTVPGGADNCAGGAYSWAGGRRAKIRPGTNSGPAGDGCSGISSTGANGHEGTFVWADSQNLDFVSTRSDAFLVRAAGGAEFRLDNAGLRTFSNATSINGAAVQARSENANGIAIYGSSTSTDSTLVLNNSGTGDIIRGFNGGALQLQLQSDGDLVIGGSLTQNSDRSRKEAIEPVDVQAVLDALRELPMFSWRYKHDRDVARHIGPMAQDFHEAFGYGASPNGIAVVDGQGVALAAIQALARRNAELETRVVEIGQQKDRQIAVLQARLAEMEQQQALDAHNRAFEARLAALERLVLNDRQLAEAP